MRAWLAEREADLLPVDYFHVVFTLPAEVADIALQNKAAVYGLLFQAASETMMTIAADPKHLGARIGITAVLHKWGSAMIHHPHIHMIGAGWRTVARREPVDIVAPGFPAPVRVLGKLFRRLFLTRLTALHDAGRLGFFGSLTCVSADARITSGGPGLYTAAMSRLALIVDFIRANWIARICLQLGQGEGVDPVAAPT